MELPQPDKGHLQKNETTMWLSSRHKHRHVNYVWDVAPDYQNFIKRKLEMTGKNYRVFLLVSLLQPVCQPGQRMSGSPFKFS